MSQEKDGEESDRKVNGIPQTHSVTSVQLFTKHGMPQRRYHEPLLVPLTRHHYTHQAQAFRGWRECGGPLTHNCCRGRKGSMEKIVT